MKPTIFDILSPGTREELQAIEKELLALDSWYGLASDALQRHTLLVFIDRRTRTTPPLRGGDLMAVYVSCAACGWRGCRGWPSGDQFAEHVCIRRNGYQANYADQRSGWPNDRETWRRLGGNARDAINPALREGSNE